MRLLLLISAVAGVATALKCYQGIQNASMPLIGRATTCPVPSLSCLTSYDKQTNTATRSCQTTNCTLNGVVSRTGYCQNTTSYPYQTYCCCYGDGCNMFQINSNQRVGYLLGILKSF